MPDFHAYVVTATVKMVVPAAPNGDAVTFDFATLPAKLRDALVQFLQLQANTKLASVTLPSVDVSVGEPVEVPA